MDPLIESLPEDLRLRLKAQAELHHRSMAGEACAILTANLHAPDKEAVVKSRYPMPPLADEDIERLRAEAREHKPFVGKTPLTDEVINRAKRMGRA